MKGNIAWQSDARHMAVLSYASCYNAVAVDYVITLGLPVITIK